MTGHAGLSTRAGLRTAYEASGKRIVMRVPPGDWMLRERVFK